MIRTVEESRAWRPEHPGWSHDILPFYTMLAELIPHGGTFVEVGVFLGRSLRYMAEIRPDINIWAVDPWLDGESQGYTGPCEHSEYVQKHGGLFRAFVASMPDLSRIHIHRGTSDTLDVIADAVFIDGAHDHESVDNDIYNAMLWRAKFISGHDYNPEWTPEDGKDDGRAGVILAVQEAFGKPELYGTCWMVRR